jgi:hypothetical protein
VTDVGDEVLLTEEQIHAFRERHDLVGKGARDDGYQEEAQRNLDRYLVSVGVSLEIEAHPMSWKLVARAATGGVLLEQLFGSKPTESDANDLFGRCPDAAAVDVIRPLALSREPRRLPIFGERPIDAALRPALSSSDFAEWLFGGKGAVRRQRLFWAIDTQTDPCSVSVDEARLALEELLAEDPEDHDDVDGLLEDLERLAQTWLARRVSSALGRRISRDELEHRCVALDPLVPPDQPGVYCIKGAGDYVKIGCASRSIRQRISELQTSHPVKIELLAILSRDPRDERKFHDQFSALREHGEWFRFERPIFEAIKQARSCE